jgi:hypothetical protein
MKRFNPKAFGQVLPEQILVLPDHDVGWAAKAPNWWAGATIACPNNEAVAAAEDTVEKIRKAFGQGRAAVTKLYRLETDIARAAVRRVLDELESTPVLLEASGTAALLLATRMFAHIAAGNGSQSFFAITTDEGGSLVPATLRGLDPNQMETTMFQPNTGLFCQPQPVLEYPQGMEVTSQLVGLSRFDNDALVEQMRRVATEHLEAGRKFGCLVLPHVTKSGRLLPLHAVSKMVLELRKLGLNLYLVVDDIQGFTRIDGEITARPSDYCDAYVMASPKALGGPLIASAVVMQPEAVKCFLELAAARRVANYPCISHFQFASELEDRLPDSMLKDGAVSLPEIVAMRMALKLHFFRGEGRTYLERRHNQLAVVAAQRAEVVAVLNSIAGLKVLESTPERPLVPSIVSFETPKGVSPGALKDALQAGDPIVTPCAPIGRLLRLDIAEYRQLPSLEVLRERLNACLNGPTAAVEGAAPATTGTQPAEPERLPDSQPAFLPEPAQTQEVEETSETPAAQPQRPQLD